MNWRRLLWLSMSALAAWWLFLMLPPKPAWVLTPPQVPLYFSPTRIVTAAVTKEPGDTVPWIEYGPYSRNLVYGPICLRDMATGKVLGTALAAGEPCLTLEASAELRYLVGANLDRQRFAVHDLLTDERWRPHADAQLQLSPRGSLVWAISADAHGLYDTETKKLLLDVGTRYELLQMADDDSWAMFFSTTGAGTETLLWQRGQPEPRRATVPGVVLQWRLASDNRTLVALCVDPLQVIVWDVLDGKLLRQGALSFRKADLGISLAADGMLAVWSLSRSGLQFFDVATGRVASAPSTSIGGFYGFSRDGQRFAFQQWDSKRLIVLDALSGDVAWENTSSPYAWVSDGRNLLVNNGKASLRDGMTGTELGTRVPGVLSEDRRCLISDDIVSLIEAHNFPERLGRWLPFLAVKDQMRIRVTEVDTGREQLRFLRKTAKKPGAYTVRWPYVTQDRLVILSDDRSTEIWDLPPARRWEWIVGPPALLAALPWLWQLVRRRPRKSAGPVVASTEALVPGVSRP
jgi:hypothetical protein